MATAAAGFEAHPGLAVRVLVTYVVVLGLVIGMALGIRALGSTTPGSPTPRPQTGPPVTLVVPTR